VEVLTMLTTRQIIAKYGNPGTGTPDRRWEKANIITARDGNGNVPGMPGVPPRLYFMCHRLAEGRLRAAFAAAQLAAPDHTIERAGCYVFRHQRHDPRRPLSRHSWGIAVDIDPDENSARSFPPGRTPKPWSAEWRKVWPRGLPRAFVEAFEANGFVWGGRWQGFSDPMHFELGE
jgi:hypothetical protein